MSWALKTVNTLPRRASGCLLAPEQVLGRGCSSGLSAGGLKCLSEQLKSMTAKLWHRLWQWLSRNLPAVARGGRDFQKMGLDYTRGPAQVWVMLLKATPGLSLELVLKRAA